MLSGAFLGPTGGAGSELQPVEVVPRNPRDKVATVLYPVEVIAEGPPSPNSTETSESAKGAQSGAEDDRESAPATRPIVEQLERVEAEALQIPGYVVDVTLGPVREANLLLPRPLDPFTRTEDEPWFEALPIAKRLSVKREARQFKPSEQKRLLGSRLASRIDTPEEDAEWKWQIQGGGSFRQGNTATTNARGHFQAERHSIRGSVSGRIGAVFNQNADESPNRRAFGDFVCDRNLRGRWLLYGSEDAEYDEARLIDLRSVSSFGLGFRFIDRLRSRWVVRSGPSMSYWIYADEADTPDVLRSGWLVESEYRQLLIEAIRLELSSRMIPDLQSEREFRVRTQGALVFPVGGPKSHWNWKVGVNHEYQVDPVQQTKSTDVEGYFAITYAN